MIANQKWNILALGCLLILVCEVAWGQRGSDQLDELSVASQAIDQFQIRSHIRFLADDLLEGRGPGSRGDQLAQLYISTQMQSMGLKPAAADGSWRQRVPLVGVTSNLPKFIRFRNGERSVELNYFDDYIGSSGIPKNEVGFENAEVVFVGYGIQAPEYRWDDFKGVDLKGKVLLIMNNDPADDPELFAGHRRLYYGRWDYKFESAARQGAAAAFVIHTTPSAGYPFQVVQTSWSGEEFELRESQGPRLQFRGWTTEDAARRIVAFSSNDLDALRRYAETREFKPVPLGVSLSMQVTCQVRERDTANVFGILEGSHPQLKKEAVVYMAHHDHIGLATQRNQDGDNIYNGAIDNASGSATLLAIARAYSKMPQRPNRSILFAAVGAEEQGLLGSLYMSEHPPIHPGNLTAVINMDGMNFLGRTHDVNVVGNGKSSLDTILAQVAKSQNRVVVPDLFPDRGYYYRSDQFSLAKIGVPGVYLHSGVNVIGKPDGWGKQQLEEWTDKIYHQPSDEYRDDWNLEGAVEDTQLLFQVGGLIANQTDAPTWTPGDEFEAARKKAIAEKKSVQFSE